MPLKTQKKPRTAFWFFDFFSRAVRGFFSSYSRQYPKIGYFHFLFFILFYTKSLIFFILYFLYVFIKSKYEKMLKKGHKGIKNRVKSL
jgi:hypothetical protein